MSSAVRKDLVAGGPRTVAVSVDMDAPENYAEFYKRRQRSDAKVLPLGEFYGEPLDTLLEIFQENRIRGTFFCIGEHTKKKAGEKAIRKIAAHDHEIANHSFSHPAGFRRLTSKEKATEIKKAHEALADAAGAAPVGFRAPAYDLDHVTLRILSRNGYAYDSSVLPSLWLLPMKLMVRWRARRFLWKEPAGLGSWIQGFRDKRPRSITLGAPKNGQDTRSLVELPLSVVPWTRRPFYGSFTQKLGLGWFERGLKRLREGNLPINYSIHLQELAETPPGVPAYEKPPEERIAILTQSLARLAEGSECIPLKELADRIPRS